MMKSSFTALLLVLLLTLGVAWPRSFAGETLERPMPPIANAPQPDVSQFLVARALAGYDKLLRDHVDADGYVDYQAIAAEPKFLDLYVEALSEESLLDSDDPAEKLAILINAYNAFTLKLIIDNYHTPGGGVIESITDLHGGKPWDQKQWNLAGKKVSLNQIEHEMIRPVFDEPRIHWALVCAAYSCPPLRAEAYTAKQLEAQLASQEAYVLNAEHPRYLRQQGGQLSVTKIFEWYGQDFGPDWKTYITGYLDVPMPETIDFIQYDWKLNSRANRSE